MSTGRLIEDRTVSLQSGLEVVVFVRLLPVVPLVNVTVITVLENPSTTVSAGKGVVVVTAAVMSFVVVVGSADVVVLLRIVPVAVIVLVGAVVD